MKLSDKLDAVAKFSSEKLVEIEKKLTHTDDWCFVLNGSYARREASRHSDIDYFILHKSSISRSSAKSIHSDAKKVAKAVIGKLPSADGAFGVSLQLGDLEKNIGGEKDTNKRFTRRALFLLEGRAANNLELFEKQRDALINSYIHDEIKDHQLALFLLNDIIRFYRTMCVDYEFKINITQKPWPIRNIKLVFSRKLLYFSGLLIVAQTAQRSASKKREIVRELCQLTPVERIQHICGSAADAALTSYSIFLEALDNSGIRALLNDNDMDPGCQQYRELKDEGQHFTYHLLRALSATYPDVHPIHRCVVF